MATAAPAVQSSGGVGKITTTVDLAYAFLSQGKRVLAVDLIPRRACRYRSGPDPKPNGALLVAGHPSYFELVNGGPLKEMIVERAAMGRPDLAPASIRRPKRR